jgi:hypothetical protein
MPSRNSFHLSAEGGSLPDKDRQAGWQAGAYGGKVNFAISQQINGFSRSIRFIRSIR